MGRQSNSIDDLDFGSIEIHRRDTNYIKLQIKPNGKIAVSAPRATSIARIQEFIDNNRPQIVTALKHTQTNYLDNSRISRNRQLKIHYGVRQSFKLDRNYLHVTLSSGATNHDNDQFLRQCIVNTWRDEAKFYLPRRLRVLATRHNCNYRKVRLTHAKTRWGSCSSAGTISLNIALMKLDDDLIDYVICHELAHTKHMNHGTEFWGTLESILPGARQLDRRLKRQSPFV